MMSSVAETAATHFSPIVISDVNMLEGAQLPEIRRLASAFSSAVGLLFFMSRVCGA